MGSPARKPFVALVWWQGRQFQESLALFRFFVAVLMPPGAMCAVSAQEEQESVLARAYFRWSAEGWNATTKDGERVRLGHREI